MLPGVLLHVIEAPIPIDGAVHGCLRGRPIDHVRNAPIVQIDDVENAGVAQRSGVVGLAAG